MNFEYAMNLPDTDIPLFYKLYPSLLFFVNEKFHVVPGLSTPEEMRQSGHEQVYKVAQKLYDNIHTIDDFIKENPFDFPTDELEIVASWKHFIRGRFYVYSHLKKYTVFLSSDEPVKAYGVYSLVDPIEDVIGPYLPVLVQTTLLPFKGKIVYDGVFMCSQVTFGSGYRAGLKEAYQEAKGRYGIVESLPFYEAHESDSDILKRYLATKDSRERYRAEVYALIGKSRDLQIVYHQTMGAIHARSYKKDLRAAGISRGWFGVFRGLIVASGRTEENVERSIQDLIPDGQQIFVHVFRL